MESDTFEQWRESRGITKGNPHHAWLLLGWNGRGIEDAKPQDASTCPKGHPRWALVEVSVKALGHLFEVPSGKPIPPAPLPKLYKCSICAEVAKVEQRCNKLEHIIGQIALLLREDMTSGNSK